jgi:hypothetical protein
LNCSFCPSLHSDVLIFESSIEDGIEKANLSRYSKLDFSSCKRP